MHESTQQTAIVFAPFARASWLEAALPSSLSLTKQPLDAVTTSAVLVTAARHAAVLFVYCDTSLRTQIIPMIAAVHQTLSSVVIIAISDDEQPADLELAAIRAGAREFIAEPRDRPQIQQTLTRCIGSQSPVRKAEITQQRAGRSTAIVNALSDRNTAWFALHLALATRPRTTLLIDLSTPRGASLSFLNINSSYRLPEAIADRMRVDATLIETAYPHHSSGLSVLVLPDEFNASATLIEADLMDFLRIVSTQFEQVILAIDPLIGVDLCATILSSVEQGYVLLDPTILASHHCHALITQLRQSDHLLPPLSLVVDRSEWVSGLTAERIQSVLECPIASTLSGDPETRLTAMNAGTPLPTHAPRDGYWRAVQALAHVRMGRATPADARAPSKGLLGWLQQAVGS